jgi:hypothetical protein
MKRDGQRYRHDPLPAALALFLGGLDLSGFLKRRKRQKALIAAQADGL